MQPIRPKPSHERAFTEAVQKIIDGDPPGPAAPAFEAPPSAAQVRARDALFQVARCADALGGPAAPRRHLVRAVLAAAHLLGGPLAPAPALPDVPGDPAAAWDAAWRAWSDATSADAPPALVGAYEALHDAVEQALLALRPAGVPAPRLGDRARSAAGRYGRRVGAWLLGVK